MKLARQTIDLNFEGKKKRKEIGAMKMIRNVLI